MNSVIVDNINKKVGPDDTLIHLGDVAFGGVEKIGQFLDRLVCKNVHLVLGNHDQNIKKNRENNNDKFLSIQNYLEVNIGGVDFVLSHYPLSSWNQLNKGSIHLHGHVHLPRNKRFGKGKKMDVGMDGNNLYPYSISEIVHMMDKRCVESETNGDHHLDVIIDLVG
jgi:calcineurin-like phosphoesterase family protein